MNDHNVFEEKQKLIPKTKKQFISGVNERVLLFYSATHDALSINECRRKTREECFFANRIKVIYHYILKARMGA